MAYADAAAEGRELPVTRLAERLRRGGYGVRVRTALGGAGAGGSIDGECLRNLRHSFLSVSLPGEPGGALGQWVRSGEDYGQEHPSTATIRSSMRALSASLFIMFQVQCRAW